MESFGKFLARKRILTQSELEEATQYLVVVGGRLGTNLVDLGYLGIEELDRHLAEHLGTETPPKAWVEQPSPEALALLPRLLAQRHMILPLAVADKTLHLAMADPHHPTAMDEVSFATGLGIRPYLLSDAHLAFLRERFLGIPREGRFAYLAPEWAQGHSPKERSTISCAEAASGTPEWAQGHSPKERPAPAARPDAPEEVEAAAKQRVACGLHPLEAEEELTDAETFSSLHTAWTAENAESSEAMILSDVVSEGVSDVEAAPAAEVRPLEPEEVAELEARLASAPDREVISDCALRLARTYAAAAALFVVRRDVIRGCGAVGSGVPRDTEGFFIPLASASVLAATVTDGEAFRGALPADRIDEQLFRAIGRCDVREAAIFPVRIRDRVLNVLYVDNGPHPLAESSIAALGAVCDGIARAYARLILLTKRRHC